MLQNPPEGVVLHTESVVQHRGDIVLPVELGQKMGISYTIATRQQRTNLERTIQEKGRETAFTDCQVQSQEARRASGGHEACGRGQSAGPRCIPGSRLPGPGR